MEKRKFKTGQVVVKLKSNHLARIALIDKKGIHYELVRESKELRLIPLPKIRRLNRKELGR